MSARSFVGLFALSLTLAGCESTLVNTSPLLDPPANLTYALDPSGDPARPAGILLQWDDLGDPALASYRVYSRGSTGGAFGLRGETTSNTFHDNGIPHLQYYVTAVDVNGVESDPSNAITVDERLQLESPTSLGSISLNGAIHLDWTDNAFLSDPQRFKWYRVYSASYDLDHGLCGTDWSLEGTTVSPEFLVGALTNGVPRCFGVSAISVEGYESLWSPLWQDTPRPDARNLLVFAFDQNSAQAGFRFWDDVNQDGVAQPSELGLVEDGNRTDIDFWIYRDPTDSTLWIVPEFSGTSMRLYANTPVSDLTDIDFAPASGYSRNMIQAAPGFGYVFQIVEGGTLRYAALRVTHVGRDYLIFDWSLQTDPGNPELVVHANLPTAVETGIMVQGAR
jgi:fibronectin type 3 domain-containing protein